jgi:hypothetical protein
METVMKFFKHMEMVVMVAFFGVCAIGSLQLGTPARAVTAGAASEPATIAPSAGYSAAPEAMPMPVVRVIGHRLTAAEKRSAG